MSAVYGTIGVALRKSTKPTWHDWLAGAYRFTHAQIILPAPCVPAVGQPLCSLCRERQQPLAAAPRDGMHRVTFKVTQETGVIRRVDQNYDLDKWEVWLIPVLLDQVRTLASWLNEQRGLKFNTAALQRYERCAPALCLLPPCCLPFCAEGVHDGRKPNPTDTWLCTELCIAALHRIGLLQRASACATAPDRLAALLARVEGARRV